MESGSGGVVDGKRDSLAPDCKLPSDTSPNSLKADKMKAESPPNLQEH